MEARSVERERRYQVLEEWVEQERQERLFNIIFHLCTEILKK